MKRLSIQIVGVRFDIEHCESELLRYTFAFMDAYESASTTVPVFRVAVDISRCELVPLQASARTVPIHRSKHRYWTFDGHLVREQPRIVRWTTRGIQCTVEESGRRLGIEVDHKTDATFAGEAIFHAMRGIALVRRMPGAMLHASSVVVGGRAIAFTGDVLAGKTSLLTAAVMQHGAQPLANDRVVLREHIGKMYAMSWPSYASYCEGTLLAFPRLASASLAYESEESGYRTQRWSTPLTRSFVKNQKRIYPMKWFTAATECSFCHEAPLAAVVFSHVSPEVHRWRLEVFNLHEADVRADLANRFLGLLFTGEDESFLPWHEIRVPASETRGWALVNALYEQEVPVFELQAPAGEFYGLGDILNQLSDQ